MRYPLTHFAAFAFGWLALEIAHLLITGDEQRFLYHGVKDIFPLAAGFWGYHLMAKAHAHEARADALRPRPGSEGGTE